MVDNQTQAAAAAQLIETWTDEQLAVEYHASHSVMTWADAISLVDAACGVATMHGMDGPQLRQAMRVITKGCH